MTRVVIQGQASAWGSIEAGVPQGSVLGPLMFLIYVNDIVDIIKSEIRLFPDDTTLYIQMDNPAVWGIRLHKYSGAKPFTILNMRTSFCLRLRSERVSQPVSSYILL